MNVTGTNTSTDWRNSLNFSLLPLKGLGLFKAISLAPLETGVAMVIVEGMGFWFVCWKCKSCENRFLMGLFSGLSSVQSSPLIIVEDAKESSSVLVLR